MTDSQPEWWEQAEPELHQVVEGFTEKLRKKLRSRPATIIKRKNPFLFRIRNAADISELAWKILDAYTSSSEETIFGKDVMEKLAITVCKHALGGQKAGIKGIDLEYTDRNNIRTVVEVKSGVNWGNARQHEALRLDFRRVVRTIRQGGPITVRCIEGCCYGPNSTDDFGDYERLVGEDFWEEITGWKGTGLAVFRLLGQHAENGLQADREKAHAKMVNYLYEREVGNSNGINWEKLFTIVMRGV